MARAATQHEHEQLGSSLRSRGFDKIRSNGRGHGYRVGCSQCQAMCVNGVAIHETGCPNDPDQRRRRFGHNEEDD